MKVSLKSSLFSFASNWIKYDAAEDLKYAKKRVSDLKLEKIKRMAEAKKCVAELLAMCEAEGSPVSGLTHQSEYEIAVNLVVAEESTVRRIRRSEIGSNITFEIAQGDLRAWHAAFGTLTEDGKCFSRHENGVDFINIELKLEGFDYIRLRYEMILPEGAPCKVQVQTSTYRSLSCPMK